MKVVDGSKVILIASQGLHQGAQIAAPSQRIAAAVPQQVREEPQLLRKVEHRNQRMLSAKANLIFGNEREVPEEVWDSGPSVHILDVSNNCIKEIPHKIAALNSLNKLLLTANDIADENIYKRPKVVGPFPGPYPSGSYVHRAARTGWLHRKE